LLDQEYRGLVISGTVLAMATVSDAFIYLLVQRRLAAPMMAFPLLYVGTSLFTAMLAVPCGRLADRLGRRRVLLGGYALLGIVYAVLIAPAHIPGTMVAVVIVTLLGGYYAATDGVLTAMTAARLSSARTGTGLSVLMTSINLSRLAASVVFGSVWTFGGTTVATGGYLGLLAIAMVAASFMLPRDADNARHG
jgi:MFS family permease